MYVIIWEYQVKAEQLAAFEKIYASDGAWAELFSKDEGYLGTELLRDPTHPQRYITIDRWISSRAYHSFVAKRKQDYDHLDSRCKDLTEYEALVGTLSPVRPGG